jgi:hypothetical protein
MFTSGSLKDLELAYHTFDVRPSWDVFATILRCCPAMETLSLSASGPAPEPPDWPTEDPIVLPAMKQLVLEHNSDAYLRSFLPRLSLPALDSLVLNLDEEDYTAFVTLLIGTPILPQITSLEIGILLCNIEAIKLIYNRVKNLHALKLSMSYLDGPFLTLLGVEIAGKLPMPHLEALSVSDMLIDDLKTVVQERKRLGHPIKKLSVGHVDLDGQVAKWFKENVDVFDTFEPSDDEDEDEVVTIGEDEVMTLTVDDGSEL